MPSSGLGSSDRSKGLMPTRTSPITAHRVRPRSAERDQHVRVDDQKSDHQQRTCPRPVPVYADFDFVMGLTRRRTVTERRDSIRRTERGGDPKDQVQNQREHRQEQQPERLRPQGVRRRLRRRPVDRHLVRQQGPVRGRQDEHQDEDPLRRPFVVEELLQSGASSRTATPALAAESSPVSRRRRRGPERPRPARPPRVLRVSDPTRISSRLLRRGRAPRRWSQRARLAGCSRARTPST